MVFTCYITHRLECRIMQPQPTGKKSLLSSIAVNTLIKDRSCGYKYNEQVEHADFCVVAFTSLLKCGNLLGFSVFS